jgi:hypothetical protein
MDPNNPADKTDLQALLVEYDKAQDSAQHHDSLVWTSVSFIFGGMLVLLRFVLNSLDKLGPMVAPPNRAKATIAPASLTS